MHRILQFCLPMAAVCAALVASPGTASASDPSTPPDLSGTWAQKVVLTSISDPPVVGTVQSQTITYLVYEIDQDGRNLTLETSTCEVRIESETSLIRTVLPDRFPDSIPDQTRRGRLVEEDGETTLEITKSYSVLGATLRVPENEQLPTEPGDARIVDVDGDGHPGVTVRIEGMIGGEMYVVQRAWDRYRGRLVSDRRVTGVVDWNVEQNILDATSIFLQSQPPTKPHPDPDRSRFEMVRLDPGTGCNHVLRDRKQIFGGP